MIARREQRRVERLNVVYPACSRLLRTDSQSVTPFFRKWQLEKGVSLR